MVNFSPIQAEILAWIEDLFKDAQEHAEQLGKLSKAMRHVEAGRNRTIIKSLWLLACHWEKLSENFVANDVRGPLLEQCSGQIKELIRSQSRTGGGNSNGK